MSDRTVEVKAGHDNNVMGGQPQNVLVIGATSDMAQAAARLWAGQKARIFLIGRDAAKLHIVTQDLKVRGAGDVGVGVGDLADHTRHMGLVQDAMRFLGSLDIVLMAHGIQGEQEDLARDYAAAEQVFRVNVLSYLSLVQQLKGHLIANKGSTLAIISSVAGDRGRGSNYIYGASKAALTAVASGLRQELLPHGVQVLTILPGFVATKLTAHLKQGPLFAKPESVGRDIVKAVEKKRDVVYTPFFWSFIMLIITHIPEKIFRKLKI